MDNYDNNVHDAVLESKPIQRVKAADEIVE